MRRPQQDPTPAPAAGALVAPAAGALVAPAADAFVGRPGDFDFLVGHWAVRNRRLQTRLAGAQDWIEFPALQRAWSHLQGLVSVDEIEFPSLGFAGCSWRSLDLARGQWAIYWINSRTGRVYPPVHGGWAGARGEFHGEDEDDGRPVRVRFVWERLGPDAARWTQAFSVDGGRRWEDNWVMDFTRLAGGAAGPCPAQEKS